MGIPPASFDPRTVPPIVRPLRGPVPVKPEPVQPKARKPGWVD